MRLFLFRTKSQPGATYESVAYKKICNVVSQSTKNEEITFPYEFIFVFTSYIIWATFSTKCQSWALSKFRKNIERGEITIQWIVYGKGFKASAHYHLCLMRLTSTHGRPTSNKKITQKSRKFNNRLHVTSLTTSVDQFFSFR